MNHQPELLRRHPLRNSLLLKVGNRAEGLLGFYARLSDDAGNAIPGLVYSVNGGPETTEQIFGTRRALTDVSAGHTFFLEDLELARSFFPRLVGLRAGRVVFDGPADGLGESGPRGGGSTGPRHRLRTAEQGSSLAEVPSRVARRFGGDLLRCAGRDRRR